MAIIPYDRITNLQNDQALAPSDPYPAQKLDQEYNALKITTDDIIQHLDLIQRDDGQLENDSVGLDQLREEVQIGFNAPHPWVTDHDYILGDTVFNDNKFWYCLVAHTSTIFYNDHASGYWSLIADFTGAATIGAAMYVSDGPPVGAQHGAQWLESDTGNTYVFYNDGTSAQWIHTNGSSVGAVSGGGATTNVESRAALVATTIPATTTFMQTAGYYAPGDGGGALYKRVGAEPTHGGKVQSFDGAWWEIEKSGEVNARAFGAKGDGTANDAPALQAALDYLAIPHAGGALYLPKGRYLVNTGLIVGNAIHIRGDGYSGDGSSLIINGTTNAPAVTCGNLAGQSAGYKVSNVNFAQQQGVTPVAGNCGLRIRNCIDAMVNDVGFTSYPAALYDGFRTSDVCQFMRVEGLLVSNCLHNGVVFEDTFDLNVVGSRSDANIGTGWQLSSCNGVYFDAATAFGNGAFGFHIAPPITPANQNANMFFSKCIGDTSGQHNWLIESLAVSTFSQCWGCTQINPAVNTWAVGFALNGSLMDNIEFIGCIAALNNSHGMLIVTGKNILIQGGMFGTTWNGLDHGNGRSGAGSGIYVAAGATSVEINNVMCSVNAGYGVALEAAGNTRITGGRLGSNDTGAIQNRGNAVRVSGVAGVNPVGGGIAPAMPASTVPVVNNTGVDVMVSVIGGSLTNITVNGAFIFNRSDVTFYLPAGGTVSMTYSVAPLLWQWQGM